MSDVFRPYHARQTSVKAVQVTRGNAIDVARACGGHTWASSVIVPPEQVAPVTSWVVQIGPRRFQVWSDKAFQDAWVPVVQPKVVYQPVADDE